VSAAISVETGISEADIANALEETPLLRLDGHLVPPSDIVITAELTGELHDEGPYDVVHSHVHHFSGLILEVARLAGVPVRIAHSHSDFNTLVYREMESTLMQGITTVVAGQCGSTNAPVNPEFRETFEKEANAQLPPGVKIKVTWSTFDEYLREEEKAGLGASLRRCLLRTISANPTHGWLRSVISTPFAPCREER
jgi:hypothetical protein